jgi:hypothetical protein
LCVDLDLCRPNCTAKLILEGYESKTQPREFYEKARDYIPSSPNVDVKYLPGGHFWTLESPEETTDAIKYLLTM